MNSSEKYIKTDNSNFKKDTDTGALVSTDMSNFLQYKLKIEQTAKLKNQENDLNNIKSEVSDLKDEIGEIKDMLHQLLNK